MAFTGFDPNKVNNSMSKVQSAYTNLYNVLVTNTQNQVVNDMGKNWACNDAIKFFATFKQAIDSHASEATRIFDSVMKAMSSAGKAWAAQTGTSFTGKSFSARNQKLSVSAIKENLNGTRGIDYSAAQSSIAKLNNVRSQAESALTEAINAVRTSGFIGGSQEQQLINSLTKIKSNISSSFNELSQAAKKAVDNTVKTYGDIQSKIETSFSGN